MSEVDAKIGALGALIGGFGIAVSETRRFPTTDGLFPEEAEFVAGAVESRRREFAAGRACAHESLAALGLPAAPLPTNPDRRPAWPADIVGSITHTCDYAAAAVAWRRDIRSLGVDAENIGRVGPHLIPYICTPREQAHLSSIPTAKRDVMLTLLFSGKESYFKCLYDIRPQLMEFVDLEIEVVSSNVFSIRAVGEVGAIPRDADLICRYALVDSLVLSAVVLRPG